MKKQFRFNEQQIKCAVSVVVENTIKNLTITENNTERLPNYKPKHILNENQVSKSIDAAKNLYIQRTGKSREDADYFVRVALRNDIDSLRSEKGGKFILGATRIALDGELNDERTINSFNRTIKLIAAAHSNEYDRNLNGETAATLIQRFSSVIKSMDDKDREEIGRMQYTKNSLYTIVPIDDFDEAQKYGRYTSWCVTHDEEMLNNYTNGGIGQFYFCLRNDYKEVPKETGEGCPLDEYGLSMVAVSVDENGNLHTCTCRWNHDNGGNDSIMDTKQISQLIGQNFYEVFKPNNKWNNMLSTALQRLENGESPNEIFDYCGKFFEGFARVKLNSKYNFINTDGKILSKQWFVACGNFFNGFARVKLNDKLNFISTDGQFLSKQGFEYCDDFIEGFACVSLNRKYNFIKADGQILSNQWFDGCGNFSEGFAKVWLNRKYNFINTDGKFLFKQWLDGCGNFSEGFAWVNLNGKYNFINTDGKILSKQWFDNCGNFKEGHAVVELNGKRNFIKTDGQILSKKWV